MTYFNRNKTVYDTKIGYNSSIILDFTDVKHNEQKNIRDEIQMWKDNNNIDFIYSKRSP